MPSFELDSDEADAIAELFNIGMGQPAADLGSIIGEEVLLSVPALRVATRSSVSRDVGSEAAERACAVSELFSGSFAGEAMLIFPERGGLALVRRLVPDADAGEAGELERDALTEIGNIILNGCLASFSNLVEGELESGVPDYRAGPAGQLIGQADDPVLFVRIDVALASGDAAGHVLFLLDIASIEAFRQAIGKVLANLG